MRLDWLLPDRLVEADEGTACGAPLFHECRHCGAKFDENRDRCAVCGASEIATYTFGKDRNE